MTVGDPFDFVGGADDVGVVCIHGFTGSPYEMRYLGQALAADGMSVRGPALPGHNTSLDDLDGTRWEDWAGAVEAEVRMMCDRHRRVAVVGQSLGGLLALHVAAALGDRLSAVVSLAAPLWLDGLGGRVARWLTSPHQTTRERVLRWAPRLPKLGGSDVLDAAAKAENPSYRAVPTRALGELLAFMPVVDAELPQIAAPLLVIHGSHDHTAPVDCALRIAHRARARRLRILPRSYHLIAIDVERDLVAAEVRTFIRKN